MVFVIECAVSAALFGLLILKTHFIIKQEDKMQKSSCKPLGFLLLLPSIGMIACATHFLFVPEINLSTNFAYLLIGISAAVVVCLVLYIVKIYKNTTVAHRFARQINFAALAPPLSLLVALILKVTEVKGKYNIATLVCLSSAAFGGAAALIAINLIIVSLFDYKTTRKSLQTINKHIKSKQLVFVRISVAKDALMVFSKTAISIIALSFFMFANALYSAGLGVARFVAVRMHRQTGADQIKSYFYVGGVIFLSSVFYIIYSVRLFGGGKIESYPMTIALSIACYTFVEFGINIREAFRLRKSNALEAKALRAISLSSTLLGFVLTQTAIMSFASPGDNSYADALSGLFFGSIAALVGVYVMIRSLILKRKFQKT